MPVMMMAKPIKPKSSKPLAKVEEEAPSEEAAPKASKKDVSSPLSKGLTMLQTIILAVVMLIASVVGPAATLYFLGPTLLVPMIQKAMPASAEEGEEGEEGKKTEGEHGKEGKEGEHGKEAPKTPGLGMNLPMEEFIVSLKTSQASKSTQFLKAKMSLAIAVPEAEDCNASHGEEEGKEGKPEAKAEGGEHGGEGKAAEDPAVACNEAFVKKMDAYVPTLRDIVNTALMKRNASQIATLEGQEDFKDELVSEMNAVLSNHGYTVQRINLQDFIIQR
jgi:flagellar basal body-associated protein FliL